MICPVGARSGHPCGLSRFLIAALYGPGKRVRPAGQVIRALPCDVDHKALCAQFVGEMRDPQFPFESGDRRSWRRAAHVMETVPVAAGLSIVPHMPPMGQYCWSCSRRPRFPPASSQSHSRSASTAPEPPCAFLPPYGALLALCVAYLPPYGACRCLVGGPGRCRIRALPRGQARWSVYPRGSPPVGGRARAVTGARAGGVAHVVAPARDDGASNARHRFISSDAQRSNWRSLQVRSIGNASRGRRSRRERVAPDHCLRLLGLRARCLIPGRVQRRVPLPGPGSIAMPGPCASASCRASSAITAARGTTAGRGCDQPPAPGT